MAGDPTAGLASSLRRAPQPHGRHPSPLLSRRLAGRPAPGRRRSTGRGGGPPPRPRSRRARLPPSRLSARRRSRCVTINASSSRRRLSRRVVSSPDDSRCSRCCCTASTSSSTPSPSTASVATIGGRQVDHLRQVEHLLEVPPGVVDPGPVGLVDDEHVADLHQPGLVGLHRVAPAGVDHHHGGVGRARDLHLDLADADRLDDHPPVAHRVEHPDRLGRGERQPAEVAAGRHRADEHRRGRGRGRSCAPGHRGWRRPRTATTGRRRAPRRARRRPRRGAGRPARS